MGTIWGSAAQLDRAPSIGRSRGRRGAADILNNSRSDELPDLFVCKTRIGPSICDTGANVPAKADLGVRTPPKPFDPHCTTRQCEETEWHAAARTRIPSRPEHTTLFNQRSEAIVVPPHREPKFGRNHSRFGRARPNFSRFRAKYGQVRAKFDQVRAKVDRCRAGVYDSTHCWGLNSVEQVPSLVEFGQVRRFRVEVGRNRAPFARICVKFGRIA